MSLFRKKPSSSSTKKDSFRQSVENLNVIGRLPMFMSNMIGKKPLSLSVSDLSNARNSAARSSKAPVKPGSSSASGPSWTKRSTSVQESVTVPKSDRLVVPQIQLLACSPHGSDTSSQPSDDEVELVASKRQGLRGSSAAIANLAGEDVFDVDAFIVIEGDEPATGISAQNNGASGKLTNGSGLPKRAFSVDAVCGPVDVPVDLQHNSDAGVSVLQGELRSRLMSSDVIIGKPEWNSDDFDDEGRRASFSTNRDCKSNRQPRLSLPTSKVR
jgi:hypothetical protein